jgi:hypothetical protein
MCAYYGAPGRDILNPALVSIYDKSKQGWLGIIAKVGFTISLAPASYGPCVLHCVVMEITPVCDTGFLWRAVKNHYFMTFCVLCKLFTAHYRKPVSHTDIFSITTRCKTYGPYAARARDTLNPTLPVWFDDNCSSFNMLCRKERITRAYNTIIMQAGNRNNNVVK